MADNGKPTTYRWVITTLVGLLCFSVGWSVQSERLRGEVITNTVKVQAMETQLIVINQKLDTLIGLRAK